MKKISLTLSLVLLTSSCANWQSGKTQDVKIDSQPSGADCRATNEISTATVRTPGTATLERSRKEIEVTCQLQNYGTGTKRVYPGANWWLLGNIANFGLGYFYDVYVGSAWSYPDIMVPLQPSAGGIHQGNFIMRDFQNPAVMQNETPFPAGVNQQMQQVTGNNPFAAPQLNQPNMGGQDFGTVPSSIQYQPNGAGQMPAMNQPIDPQMHIQQMQQMRMQQMNSPQQMPMNNGMPPMPPGMAGATPSPMMQALQEREAFYAKDEEEGESPFNGFWGGKK